MIDWILNLIRRNRKIRNFQYVQEDKAGVFGLVYILLVATSLVFSFIEKFQEYKKIGFPIIAAVLLVGLVLYNSLANGLLRGHRKEIKLTKGALTTWVDNFTEQLQDFKYLEVYHTYEIRSDGSGVCYKRCVVQPKDSCVPLDMFHVGCVENDDESLPLLSQIKFKAEEVEDDNKKVRMVFTEINTKYRNRIRVAIFFEPMLQPKSLPFVYEISYEWKGMWKMFVADAESRGDIDTSQDIGKRVIEYIAPAGYEFQELKIVSKPRGYTIEGPKPELYQERGKSALRWTTYNIPRGTSLSYKIIAKKVTIN